MITSSVTFSIVYYDLGSFISAIYYVLTLTLSPCMQLFYFTGKHGMYMNIRKKIVSCNGDHPCVIFIVVHLVAVAPVSCNGDRPCIMFNSASSSSCACIL